MISTTGYANNVPVTLKIILFKKKKQEFLSFRVQIPISIYKMFNYV